MLEGTIMFGDIKVKVIENEKLLFSILPFVPILLIFINSNTFQSFFIGLVALIVYLLVNGGILGRAFFEDEDSFFKLTFGLLASIVLMALTGILAVLVYPHEIWYLLGMILAAIVTSFLNLTLVRYDKSQPKVDKGKRSFPSNSFLTAAYISYAVSLLLSFWILVNERSGWFLAKPSIWAVMPPAFLNLYFISTAILAGMVVLPGKRNVKLLLIALHSTFSLLFIPVMLYPGMVSLEAWYDLGRARVVPNVVLSLYESSSLGVLSLVRALNSFLKGASVHIVVATFASTLNIDMYWIDVLLVPVMWGFFVPLTSYKLTEMIGASKRASILAALATIPNYYFLAWGKLSISDSLGNLLFFLWLYLLLRFLYSYKTRMFFLMLATLAVIVATHFLPLLMSISVALMAFALKKYEPLRLKFPNVGRLLLFFSFVISVFLLPIGVIGRGIVLPALGESAFSLAKLQKASIWSLVFGVSEDTPIQTGLLYHMIFPLLGLVGAAYTLQNKTKFKRILCFFLFLAFAIAVIDNRILEYALEGGLFGAGRLNFFRDIAILPFVALVIELLIKFLFDGAEKARSFLNWKRIATGTLICIGLSSWVVLMVYDNYAYYTWGLMGTSLEVDAIKYIDGNTHSRYVVFAPSDTAVIAEGFLGYPFPSGKLYVETNQVPSVGDMYLQMEQVEADIGYFVAPSFRFPLADFDKIISRASRTFGLLNILSNDLGDIYVFEYKIPPLPESSDVMAFYWDTPPAYYIQNNLMRIIINPVTKSFDVEDFWGDIYESIELDQALAGGNRLGNMTSLEYFDEINNQWAEWTSDANIPLLDRLQFKLIFENDSLIGLVEKENDSVQLQWESGRESTLSLGVGNFKRLFIPGLVGGRDSYDVMSREFGFLYTLSRTNDVVFHPAYNQSVTLGSLVYSQIVRDCGFNLTESVMYYDLYVHNIASKGQWADIEVWLPNEVYTGTYPPFWFSVDDGKTWVYAPYHVDVESRVPIRTIGGTEVNWIFSIPRFKMENPTEFLSYYSPTAEGGVPKLPENYTDSGGAQNRIIFSLYLPAGEKALLRLGSVAYEPRPFEVTYVFKDSYDVAYGLHNMEEGLVKLYNLGISEYVGGVALSKLPTSLFVTENERNEIHTVQITIPSDTTFYFLSAKGVDTTIDANADGIPDRI